MYFGNRGSLLTPGQHCQAGEFAVDLLCPCFMPSSLIYLTVKFPIPVSDVLSRTRCNTHKPFSHPQVNPTMGTMPLCPHPMLWHPQRNTDPHSPHINFSGGCTLTPMCLSWILIMQLVAREWLCYQSHKLTGAEGPRWWGLGFWIRQCQSGYDGEGMSRWGLQVASLGQLRRKAGGNNVVSYSSP